MERIGWNDGWLFGRDGGPVDTQVLIPHDAMLAEPRTPDSPGGIHPGWF